MKRIYASTIVLLVTIAPAVLAQTTDRAQSLPDAYPECMQRNGPDCVLPSQVVPRRAAPPAGTPVPPGVVIIPALTPPPSEGPPGVAVIPAPTPPIITPPENTTVILPRASTAKPGAVTIISPSEPSRPVTVISPSK